MNYIAGVEVVKIISDVGQLVAEVSMGSNVTAGTHKTKSVRAGVSRNVFHQDSTRHPF